MKTEFASSGCFRVNGQKKSLDVWLIYKCSICDTTWNLTVLSRVAPRSIPSDVLHGFHNNDSDLAMYHATDAGLIRRNGAEPRQPEIDIIGTDVHCDESVRIRLSSKYPINIKIEALMRKKVGLSHSEIDRLLSNGKLICVSGHDIKKHKLLGEVVVELNAKQH